MSKGRRYDREPPFGAWPAASAHGSIWRPRADMYRCRDRLLVKLELAGVAERDVRIELDGDALIVSGRRSDRIVDAAAEFVSMEITYDRFRRSLRLPVAVDATRLETDYRDGMLFITLPYRGKGRQ